MVSELPMVLRDSCSRFTGTENISKFDRRTISWLKNARAKKNTSSNYKESSRPENQNKFFMGERYYLHIVCHGIENLKYLP